jgi:Fe-S-cluster formation regulator IscX/YfhJ
MSGSSANTEIILLALSSPAPSSQPSTDPTEIKRAKLAHLIVSLEAFADVHSRFHQKLASIVKAAPKAAAEEVDLEQDLEGPEGAAQVAGVPDLRKEELKEVGGVLPALVPSVEEGVGAVREMIRMLEGLRNESL